MGAGSREQYTRPPQPQGGQGSILSRYWKVVAVFILATGLRVFDIGADAPLDLSPTSTAPYVDEGHKTYPAKNMALFGKWTTLEGESRGTFETCPVHALLYTGLFRVFGVTIEVARFGSVLAGVLSLVLCFLLSVKLWDWRAGVWTLAIVGFEYYFVFYTRLALQEAWVVFFILVGLSAWTFVRPAWVAGVLAGMSLFMAHLVKPMILPVLLGFGLAGIIVRPETETGSPARPAKLARAWAARILPVFGCFGACFVAWSVLTWSMGMVGATKMQGLVMEHVDVSGASLWLRVLRFFEGGASLHSPLVWLGFFGYIWWLVRGRIKWYRLCRGEDALVGVALTLMVTFAVLGYRPTRYQVLLFVPMGLLAARWATMEGNREESPGISLPRRIGGALLAGALAYGMAFSIAEAIPYDLPVILVAGLVGALVFVLDGSSILKIGRLAFNVLPRSRRLLVVLTVVPLVFYVAWAVTRTHLTREAIATVERVMPTGSVIVNPAAENNTAAAICWTDRIRGVCIDFRAWNRYGPAETLRRIGATHVFLDAGKPPESQLPEEIRRAYEIEKVMDVRLKHKTYAVFVLRTR